MDLVQKINEVDNLAILTNKNVVFKKRSIKNVYVSEGEMCTIEWIKFSDEGEKIETTQIPFQNFSEMVEEHLWKLVDVIRERGDD